jgi:hypothetical protein
MDGAQRLRARHGGWGGVFRLDVAQLARIRGLGDAKALRVKAALALGRRLAALAPEERPPVGSLEDVADLLGTRIVALQQEQERLRVALLEQVLAQGSVQMPARDDQMRQGHVLRKRRRGRKDAVSTFTSEWHPDQLRIRNFPTHYRRMNLIIDNCSDHPMM